MKKVYTSREIFYRAVMRLHEEKGLPFDWCFARVKEHESEAFEDVIFATFEAFRVWKSRYERKLDTINDISNTYREETSKIMTISRGGREEDIVSARLTIKTRPVNQTSDPRIHDHDQLIHEENIRFKKLCRQHKWPIPKGI